MDILSLIKESLAIDYDLQFRLIAQEDLEEVRTLHNHPKILSQLSNTNPVSKSQQEQWFSRLRNDSSMARVVIRNLETRSLIGVFRIDKVDNINRTVGIGLDVEPNIHGRGFGKRIYVYMLDLLFFQCQIYKVHLETLATNLVAQGLYESLGMTREGRGRQAIERRAGREDLLYYGLLEPEWQKKRNGWPVGGQ